MKKYFVMASVAVIAGALLVFHSAHALPKPSDYGLHEGDIIGAQSSGDPDIFIVNDLGYKRLFVSPQIFALYGHLRYDGIRPVSSAIRDAFPTSGLFRNCETGGQQVWALEVISEDTAILHAVMVGGDEAVRQDPEFFKKVFCINSREENLYPKSGVAYTSLAQLPRYARGTGTPIPTLTATPSTTVSPTTTPLATPTPTPTPTATATPMSVSVYGNPAVSLANVAIRAFYVVPKDRAPYATWNSRVTDLAQQAASFHEREFGGASHAMVAVYPNVVVSTKTTQELRQVSFQRDFCEQVSKIVPPNRNTFTSYAVFADFGEYDNVNGFCEANQKNIAPTCSARAGSPTIAQCFGSASDYLSDFYGSGYMGCGVITEDGWKNDIPGVSSVVYHEGVGHTMAMPHLKPPSQTGVMGLAYSRCLDLNATYVEPEIKAKMVNFSYVAQTAPGILEAEGLSILSRTGGRTQVQEMTDFAPAVWSGDNQLSWRGGTVGNKVTFTIPVTQAGTYTVKAQFTKAPDYAIVQPWLDGVRIGNQIDLYGAVAPTGILTLGQKMLSAGDHQLTLEFVGANPSAGSPLWPGLQAGLDYVRFDLP